jgi:hypothetical protein
VLSTPTKKLTARLGSELVSWGSDLSQKEEEEKKKKKSNIV